MTCGWKGHGRHHGSANLWTVYAKGLKTQIVIWWAGFESHLVVLFTVKSNLSRQTSVEHLQMVYLQLVPSVPALDDVR